jgi:mRNA-degrading endonuclease RelE of RelBE toxin-antitoxin system
MQKITFQELPEFQKDFKRLVKKYPSLPHDFELRKAVLEFFPKGRGMDVDQIPNLKIQSKIYKARIDCASLKRDSIRLIYCYDEVASLITMIEIYFKGEQKLENRERIFKNFN